MTIETALRLTEVMLALAFLQQSAEHILGKTDWLLFLPRALLCFGLLADVLVPAVLLLLTLQSVLVLHRYQGPYNGGSDRMGNLVLYCLTLAQFLPTGTPQELAFGYLALQVVLSYFISGKVKIVNPEWRSGRALQDVFRFSAYPVSEGLRDLAKRPMLLRGASWAVMLFEIAFPFAFLDRALLFAALGVAAVFHIANACLFGLNRFVWAWLAAYPSLIWLQARLMQGG